MVADAARGNDEPADAVTQQFVELRKYIEYSHESLSRRFDGLEQRFDGLEQRFDGLERRFDGLERRMDGLEHRFDGLDRRMDSGFARIERKIDALATTRRPSRRRRKR